MNSTAYEKGFRNLIVWKEAHALTLFVYKLSSLFPKSEQFGITSQMRRASSSIAAQLAEGSRMPTMSHRKLYYDRSYASAAELDSFFDLVKDLQYIEENDYRLGIEKINKVSFLLKRLITATQ